jgi:outer membrane receptor protein involved in Fe transport
MPSTKDLRVAVATLLLVSAAAVAPSRAAGQSDAAAPSQSAAPGAAAAESPAPQAPEPGEAPEGSYFEATTVTVLGYEADAFEVSTPVTVIDELEIARRMPDNAADLLREEPGVDVNGVGANQARPVIRGQRGLRILFLEDGLRMNNARRQTDFGELAALVDVDDIASVEVVRGPMSVLYGTDAIGGVLNLVTRPAFAPGGRSAAVDADLRYGSAGELMRVHAGVRGQSGRARYSLSGSYRDTEDYESASGTYGDIHLADEATVLDSGVTDDSLFGVFTFDLTDRQSLTLKHRRYHAGESGFGLVDSSLLGGEEDFRIRITYPFQDFDRTTLAYAGSGFGLSLLDSLDAQIYLQNNRRELANDIAINIGPIFPGAPDSSVDSLTLNSTDLRSLGFRAQAVKVLAGRQVLTWGLEGFRDDSENTDRSLTTTRIRFPFPPFEATDVSEDDVANAPNAENSSYGLFLQDEIPVGDRLKIVAGARWQKIDTRARTTPGWDISGLDFSDDNLVGAVNLLFQATDSLHLLAAWGTSFRAPSLVERLFNGVTPEGSGYQILNPDLTSESGENIDLGFKFRRSNLWMEAVWFRTDLSDGIVQDFLSPQEIAALPAEVQEAIEAGGGQFVVQQRNADELRYEGIEVAFGYRSPRSFSVGGNYTHLTGERTGPAAVPVDDQYNDKANAYFRYEPAGGRWWAQYNLRHNASVDISLEPGEPAPPVGDRLPAFTVHGLAGGLILFERGSFEHSLTLAIENLTDELYAEFSNVSFFRPEPGRHYTASYRVRF